MACNVASNVTGYFNYQSGLRVGWRFDDANKKDSSL